MLETLVQLELLIQIALISIAVLSILTTSVTTRIKSVVWAVLTRLSVRIPIIILQPLCWRSRVRRKVMIMRATSSRINRLHLAQLPLPSSTSGGSNREAMFNRMAPLVRSCIVNRVVRSAQRVALGRAEHRSFRVHGAIILH